MIPSFHIFFSINTVYSLNIQRQFYVEGMGKTTFKFSTNPKVSVFSYNNLYSLFVINPRSGTVDFTSENNLSLIRPLESFVCSDTYLLNNLQYDLEVTVTKDLSNICFTQAEFHPYPESTKFIFTYYFQDEPTPIVFNNGEQSYYQSSFSTESVLGFGSILRFPTLPEGSKINFSFINHSFTHGCVCERAIYPEEILVDYLAGNHNYGRKNPYIVLNGGCPKEQETSTSSSLEIILGIVLSVLIIIGFVASCCVWIKSCCGGAVSKPDSSSSEHGTVEVWEKVGEIRY